MPHDTNRRNIDHLIRLILNRNAEIPNFTLLLGSGASTTSKVVTATDMIELWRLELYNSARTKLALADWLRAQDWFESDDEYAILFELLYDQPSQRRTYIEECVKRAHPSWGYVYLTNLLAKKVFDVVFTTNFDDLINEACYLYSDGLRPIVAAHDSSISQIRLSSSRPKIVKLHGDFLYDNIKNTLRELESLETNTKRKLSQFAQEFGLIVVGYSGRDRSVMDTIEVLLRSEEYFPHGVYWCLRKGAAIGRRLTSLLRRDRVFLVEIEGFDELMADLNSIGHFALPQAIGSPLKVARDRARLFVEVPDPLRDHAVIRQDVANILRELDRSASSASAEDVLPPSLLAKVAEVRNDLEHAVTILQKAIAENPANSAVAVIQLVELLFKMSRIPELLDVIDNLPIDAGNKSYYLLRANANERVIAVVDEALLGPVKDSLSEAVMRINKAIALKRLGRTDGMERELAAVDELVKKGLRWPHVIAAGLAALRHDREAAQLHIGRAVSRGQLTFEQVIAFPVFAELLQDPEFQLWMWRRHTGQDPATTHRDGDEMKPPDE